MGASIHGGHRQRLRDRFLREGIDAFADHQVLELLLFHAIPRVDTNPLAHRLLGQFGSLAAVLEADPADLAAVPGLGPNAAACLALIPQVSRRYLHDRANRPRPQLSSSEAVERYVVPLMAGRPEEVFWVLCLDAQCRLIQAAMVVRPRCALPARASPWPPGGRWPAETRGAWRWREARAGTARGCPQRAPGWLRPGAAPAVRLTSCLLAVVFGGRPR